MAKAVEVICIAKENPDIHVSVLTLADLFQCRKTQIACVLRNKKFILVVYEANASLLSCHARRKPFTSAFAEVNDSLYQWYLPATSKTSTLVALNLVRKVEKLLHDLE